MTLDVDRRIFNDSVISKVVYLLSGDFTVVRQIIDADTERLSIPCDEANEPALKQRITGLLNDFKLRQIVADETRDIKTILYAKAFSDDEDLSEDDIHD